MPAVTSDQGLSLPVGLDVADNPVAFNNFVAGVEPRLVRLYASIADRTARQLVVAENELSGLADVNRVEVYNGATNISLFTRALYSVSRVTATQNLTLSSTTLQNVTNMVSTLTGAAASVYGFRGKVFYASSTTADLRLAVTIPAGATMRWGVSGLATTAASASGADASRETTTTSAAPLAIGGVGIGTIIWANVEGEVTLAAATGDLQLQAAQNTVDATQSTIVSGSSFEVWRLL